MNDDWDAAKHFTKEKPRLTEWPILTFSLDDVSRGTFDSLYLAGTVT
jgi:hypothetical protein